MTFCTTTTLNEIHACKPCEDGWQKLLKHLGKTKADDDPLEILTVLESNGLDDALWCLRVPSLERLSRHFQAWCAEQCLHLFEAEHPKDNRVRNQIEMLRNDSASAAARAAAQDAARAAAQDAALAAAWAAAQAAAWAAAWAAAQDAAQDAAWDAAWAAALEAALEAASAAAWAAARSASWAAAQDAAQDAARAAQESQLRKMIGESDDH